MNKAEGVKGEVIASKYLKKNKYKILSTNYTCKLGEIDIVAEKRGVVVFIEVKLRNSLRFGHPREAVTTHKQKKIRMVAQLFLLERKLNNSSIRFDVIDILGENITHIENAF